MYIYTHTHDIVCVCYRASVCVRVCIYIHIHIHTYIYIYNVVCVCYRASVWETTFDTFVCARACVFACLHARAGISACAHLSVCACVRACVSVCGRDADKRTAVPRCLRFSMGTPMQLAALLPTHEPHRFEMAARRCSAPGVAWVCMRLSRSPRAAALQSDAIVCAEWKTIAYGSASITVLLRPLSSEGRPFSATRACMAATRPPAPCCAREISKSVVIVSSGCTTRYLARPPRYPAAHTRARRGVAAAAAAAAGRPVSAPCVRSAHAMRTTASPSTTRAASSTARTHSHVHGQRGRRVGAHAPRQHTTTLTSRTSSARILPGYACGGKGCTG